MELSNITVKRPYEVVIIMNPDTTEEEQKKLFKKNKEIIESFSGQVIHVETWGKRHLANPIGRKEKAIYFFSAFEVEPGAISELERTMRINDFVLRFHHTRLEPGTDLSKHVEQYHDILKATADKEREREAKFQKRAQARS